MNRISPFFIYLFIFGVLSGSYPYVSSTIAERSVQIKFQNVHIDTGFMDVDRPGLDVVIPVKEPRGDFKIFMKLLNPTDYPAKCSISLRRNDENNQAINVYSATIQSESDPFPIQVREGFLSKIEVSGDLHRADKTFIGNVECNNNIRFSFDFDFDPKSFFSSSDIGVPLEDFDCNAPGLPTPLPSHCIKDIPVPPQCVPPQCVPPPVEVTDPKDTKPKPPKDTTLCNEVTVEITSVELHCCDTSVTSEGTTLDGDSENVLEETQEIPSIKSISQRKTQYSLVFTIIISLVITIFTFLFNMI